MVLSLFTAEMSNSSSYLGSVFFLVFFLAAALGTSGFLFAVLVGLYISAAVFEGLLLDADDLISSKMCP